jgi:hypothetical protein
VPTNSHPSTTSCSMGQKVNFTSAVLPHPRQQLLGLVPYSEQQGVCVFVCVYYRNAFNTCHDLICSLDIFIRSLCKPPFLIHLDDMVFMLLKRN